MLEVANPHPSYHPQPGFSFQPAYTSMANPYEKGYLSSTFTIKLPDFQYSPQKFPLIPLDQKRTNGGKFASIKSAFDYLAFHCKKYHGEISKGIIRSYLHLAYVYDQSSNRYVPVNSLIKRDFESEYRRIASNNATQ